MLGTPNRGVSNVYACVHGLLVQGPNNEPLAFL